MIFQNTQGRRVKNFHLLNSVGRLMFNTTWSLGCLVDVILHVSSSTQHDWVIFIIEISDSDTMIKNGFLKAEIVFIKIQLLLKSRNWSILKHKYYTPKLFGLYGHFISPPRVFLPSVSTNTPYTL